MNYLAQHIGYIIKFEPLYIDIIL